MVSVPRIIESSSDEDRRVLIGRSIGEESSVSSVDATSRDETLEQQVFIDAFYSDIEHSVDDSFEAQSQSSIAAGGRTESGDRGTVASNSTFLSEDMSRASTQVTENKGSVKSDQASFYDPPSLRVVRALERRREDEEDVDLPSWAIPPPRPQFHQQRVVSTPQPRRKKKHEDRIVFVLGLIGLVFFGLFCGILILLIVTNGRTTSAFRDDNKGSYSEAEGYSTTTGVVRIVDDDYYIDIETESPTGAPSKPADPLLSSLLKPQARPSVCQPPREPPPPLPGKKGIGFALRDAEENIDKLIALDPYWSHSWELQRYKDQPDHIEFVPMVTSGYDEERLREALLDQVWPHVLNGTVKRVMGFNEPDRLWQANQIGVEDAVRLWPELERLGLPLVSPSCAYPGEQWMTDFMLEVSLNCLRIDWVGVRWHGNPNFDELKSTMIAHFEKYNQPLLITEFAPVDWTATKADEEIPEDVVISFMKQAIPWLEEQAWIAGYSWNSFDKTEHPGSTAALFEADGSLTELGQYYASVRTENTGGEEPFGTSLVVNTMDQCTEYPTPPPLPGKRGLALTMRAEGSSGTWFENFPKLLQLDPYWHHSWGPERIAGQPQAIEFVPMVRITNGGLDETLRDHVAPFIPSGEVKRVLGFQISGTSVESNITIHEALAAWPKLEALDIPLVSPSAAPEDPWLDSFMREVTAGCLRVDWIATHYYGPANFTAFRSSMTSMFRKFQRPILITEMAVTDPNSTTVENNRFSSTEVLEFMKEALPWLEMQDWIAGYAWFPFPSVSPKGTSSALFDEYYNLTDCGKYYLSVTPDNPQGFQE